MNSHVAGAAEQLIRPDRNEHAFHRELVRAEDSSRRVNSGVSSLHIDCSKGQFQMHTEEDNLKLHLKRVDKKINQLHDYTRSAMLLLVTWFTVFITVNSATISWLATKDVTDLIIRVISVMFVVQNALGVAACLIVRWQIIDIDRRIACYEHFVFKTANYTHVEFPEHTSIPRTLYSVATLLMSLALLIMGSSWLIFFFVAFRRPAR